MPRPDAARSPAASTQLAGGVDQSAAGARRSRAARRSSAAAATSSPTGAQTLADGVAVARRRHRRARRRPATRRPTPCRRTPTTRRRASPTSSPTRSRPTASARRCSARPPIPLLAMLALWFGGLATFVALQAVSRRALTSRAPSALLALRGLRAGRRARRGAGTSRRRRRAARGIVRLGRRGRCSPASAIAAGVAFAAVNQALVAVFGGAGRWLVGADRRARRRDRRGLDGARACCRASRRSCRPLPPTTAWSRRSRRPPASARRSPGSRSGRCSRFVATSLAVARRRTTSARALLAASPAVA